MNAELRKRLLLTAAMILLIFVTGCGTHEQDREKSHNESEQTQLTQDVPDKTQSLQNNSSYTSKKEVSLLQSKNSDKDNVSDNSSKNESSEKEQVSKSESSSESSKKENDLQSKVPETSEFSQDERQSSQTVSSELQQETEIPIELPFEPEPNDGSFHSIDDYNVWANYTGYSSGELTAQGMQGINADYYHTPKDTAGYSSGKIVIGDSRCCQLGIYESRTDKSDFATFAVWGGHYVNAYGASIAADNILSDIEQCFQKQIEQNQKCVIYLFATVNDYDFETNANTSNIAFCVETGEKLASMTYEYEGNTYSPKVFVIGFDGCWKTDDIYGIPQGYFNQYVDEYNSNLETAVKDSSILSQWAGSYTTVPVIMSGNVTFINDGLHYSDETLEALAAYIINN